MLLKEPDDHGCKYVNVFASKLLSRKETEVSLSNSDASLATLSPVAFYCSNATTFFPLASKVLLGFVVLLAFMLALLASLVLLAFLLALLSSLVLLAFLFAFLLSNKIKYKYYCKRRPLYS